MNKDFAKALLLRCFLALGVVALFVVPLLSICNFRLSAQVDELQKKVTDASRAIAAYDRALCLSNFTVQQAKKTTRHTTSIDGTERTYYVHTPANYDASVRYPVVLNFDGISGSGLGMQEYSGLNDLPAISVYPDPLVGKEGFTAWQGAPYSLDGDGDVRLVKDIIETLPNSYCVDSTRIFAVGMSNGGGFAMIAGCELPQYIRATVGISGAYYTDCQGEGRAVSVMAVHSLDDQAVPFRGAATRGLPAIPNWAQAQAEKRDCRLKSEVSVADNAKQYTWYGCRNDSLVRMVTIGSESHGWLTLPHELKPNNYRDQTMASYVWSFLEEATYSDGTRGELY